MAKFTATKIDLVLELTTLKGEEVRLEPKVEMTAEQIVNTSEQWKNIEKENVRKPVVVMSEQIAIIYPKKASWFLQNFDVLTLSEIVTHIAITMGGAAKNDNSSN